MPELPEVQTIVKGLQPYVKNKSITKLIVKQPKLRWPVDANLAQKIENKKIISLTRRSKYLIFELEQDFLLWHLGMSGSFSFTQIHSPWEKHQHIGLTLDNETQLRYTDPRRFGFLIWTDKNPQEHKLLKNLAPEPLTQDFDADYLAKLLQGKTGAIKNFIMDSHKVVGVGNIYANESLFASGISPLRPAGKLSSQEIEKLVLEIKKVLTKALEAGGTTLKDFKNIEGNPGYFVQELQVYGRDGQNCTICQTPIITTRIGQRSSFYCPNCQK